MTSQENTRPPYDKEIQDIADYVCHHKIDSRLAYQTAYYDLLDSLACAFMALAFPACTKLLGPVVPGAQMAEGARVPGLPYCLEPVQAAFNLGVMIRWLDYNDTWLAAEWGHPSDNIGALLSVMDYLNRRSSQAASFSINDLLTSMIKAHEIQGIISIENSFNRVGLDHVLLVKVASAAVTTHLLGGSFEQVCSAVSQAWIDGASLRTYRHAPNTGARKSWAAGDAGSRAVRIALLTLAGETGYPSALSAPTWGFYDVSFSSKPFTFNRSYGSYIMENILFKIAFPAEFHGQTAAEAAIQLFPYVKGKWEQIKEVRISTQQSAMRIINKQGPLYNPADRDHCLQYIVAVSLLFGNLTAESYENETAADPRIDALRQKMRVEESRQFTRDYLDPEKRSIGNAVQVFFLDGSSTPLIAVEYPLGHRRRRQEGIPLLLEKFSRSVKQHFPSLQAEKILNLAGDENQFITTPIHHWTDLCFLEHKREF